MDGRIAAWIIALCGVCIITGCIVVPLPPGQRVYITEYNIKELLDNAASRDNVIKTLGHPERQYESDISYRTCRLGSGVFVLSEGYKVYRGDSVCYEFILHFDNNNHLANYEKILLETPYSDNLKTPNGDALPTIHVMAVKGIPESQWRLYNDYGQNPGDTIWLCRSADNGYTKAQLHLGQIYWNADDIAQNKSKAYVWYKLAATGDKLQGQLHDESTQTLAAKVMSDTEKVLTREQLEEAESLYSDWHPGQCELELIPAITDN